MTPCRDFDARRIERGKRAVNVVGGRFQVQDLPQHFAVRNEPLPLFDALLKQPMGGCFGRVCRADKDIEILELSRIRQRRALPRRVIIPAIKHLPF